MSKPTRLSAREAIEAGVPQLDGPDAMIAHLTLVDTDTLERMFFHGGRLLSAAEGQTSPATDKVAALLECISIVMVMRAEAGEISPDHPVLEMRRKVHARAAETERRH